ncbi:hypothetical protein [Acetilactobacillus jinshanensis]|uniref:Aggregation promoting factor surface protein n=1 Tax=Acetilactobacillus jinshanensis TaxID=1720083 RepID=A0A4P6ZLQ1_9LACO|nr:hypothetical protein [Acetilactobacillus jinshanensis]QBP18322.1 hypothetical protein ELX58_04040 [Acetilactobacillus jinshanensis]URL61187.1 hypothetical protein HGK75_04105 [uncultured bacterium]
MKLSRKVYLALFSLMMFVGVGASINQQSAQASQVNTTAISKKNVRKQQTAQNKPNLMNKVNNKAQTSHKNNWFRDGLSKQELAAGYLGYKNGHVNLNHKHQVKVGDTYAKTRYGSWVHAKRFWMSHGWY